MNPAVTVVIPTHLQRMTTLLPRAIQSVALQEYPAQSIHVEIDYQGLGAPGTRHRGLMKVTTPWVAFLDSDDYFYPQHLAVLMAAAQDSAADFVYSWFDVIGGTDPFPPTHFSDPWDPSNPRHTTITTMVRTELAKDVGFLRYNTAPDRQNTNEDMLFTEECNKLGHIIHVPERTWAWCHHGANTGGRPGHGDAR